MKNKKQNTIGKNGYSAINVIVGVLTILLTFSLLVEFTLLGQRYSYMAQTTSYITRVIGEQGGISSSIPSGYGDPSSYTRSSTFYNVLNDGFSDAGFDTWKVTINGKTLKSSTSIAIAEKGEIDIVVKAGFYPIFDFKGNSSRLVNIITDRTTYSSFTPRNGDIEIIK